MATKQSNRRQRTVPPTRQKRKRAQRFATGAAALVAVSTTVWLTTNGAGDDLSASLEAVESVEVGTTPRHVSGNVDYDRQPPAGGDHSPRWQSCGVYDKELIEERAVHSLEHGAVWITYSSVLSTEQIATLGELARSNDYVLVSPGHDLPSAVVMSAWGKQLELPSAEDPRLKHFAEEYANGPQTLEPGAPCSGGESSLT